MSELGKLEQEIRQLEVAIYDLKTENNLLHEALDQVIEDRDSYHEENAELRRDKDRLDWLISMVGWASTREDIDRMMRDEEDDGDLDRLNRDI
jgi:FtsZ-binding cell division protein ZapB